MRVYFLALSALIFLSNCNHTNPPEQKEAVNTPSPVNDSKPYDGIQLVPLVLQDTSYLVADDPTSGRMHLRLETYTVNTPDQELKAITEHALVGVISPFSYFEEGDDSRAALKRSMNDMLKEKRERAANGFYAPDRAFRPSTIGETDILINADGLLSFRIRHYFEQKGFDQFPKVTYSTIDTRLKKRIGKRDVFSDNSFMLVHKFIQDSLHLLDIGPIAKKTIGDGIYIGMDSTGLWFDYSIFRQAGGKRSELHIPYGSIPGLLNEYGRELADRAIAIDTSASEDGK